MDYLLYIFIIVLISIMLAIIFLPKIVKEIFMVLFCFIIFYIIILYFFPSIWLKIDKFTNTQYNDYIIKKEIKADKKIRLELQKIKNWIQNPAPNATKRLEDHYKNINDIKQNAKN